MSKLVAFIGGVAAAISVSIATGPTAQGEPFVCPFDVSTEGGRQSLKQSFDDYSARVRAINAEANDRIAQQGPEYASSPEAAANVALANQLVKERDEQTKLCYSQSVPRPANGPVADAGPAAPAPVPTNKCPFDMSTPEGRNALQQAIVDASRVVSDNQQQDTFGRDPELAVESINAQRDASNITLACQGIDSGHLPPLELPREPQPEAPVPPTLNGSCQQLVDAWSGIDPLLPGPDRFLQLRKLPGFGQISGAQMIGCGISGIPTAIANPSRENQGEVFTGLCNGVVSMVPLPVGDPCGNTPAG